MIFPSTTNIHWCCGPGPSAFVFLPKLIQQAMRADPDAAIETFGKNEQVKKVFWTLFIFMAGLVLAQVLDPVTAQQIVMMITGMGVYPLFFPVEDLPKLGGNPLRENKPYTGSFSLTCARANPVKSRKMLLFLSCGE